MELISRLLLVSAALVSVCLPFANAATAEEHVVKNISKYPYMAMVKFNNTLNCSGAIIDSNHILTAAHCVNVSGVVDLKKLEVLVGGLNSTANTTKSFKVDKLFVHANFSNRTYVNDIAILKTYRNLTSVNGTKSIALCNKSAEHMTDCTFSSWNSWKNINTSYNETMFSSEETILKDDVCKQQYVNFNSTNKYCAQDEFPICTRGGPLVCKNVIWGIATKPYTCTSGTTISPFTKISAYLPWINAILSGVSTTLPSLHLMGISFVAYYLYTN